MIGLLGVVLAVVDLLLYFKAWIRSVVGGREKYG